MHRTFGALLLALVFCLGLTGPAAAALLGPGPTPTSSLQSDLVVLVNGYRTANGLGPLSINGSLASAAAWMANDLATKNYFSHTSSDGRTSQQRMAAFGFPAYALYTGEDLAAGQPTAAEVIAGWKASPAHNAVLLSANFDAIGVGYAYNAGSTYKSYWVADFGGPGGTVAPAPAPRVAAPIPAAPAPAPITAVPAPAAADPAAPAAPADTADTADRAATATAEVRAATASRGEPRNAEQPDTALAATNDRAMRRFLHLLAVLDRLDRSPSGLPAP